MDASILKYQAFLETVRQGSFTLAAQRLSYSQSGVSRMIGDLEREWGLGLLQRSRGGVELTPDGRRLLPLVKEVCEGQRRLAACVDEIRGLDTGNVRIGVFSSVATHRLPIVISRFERDYPNVEYELLMGDYSEIERWVADGRVDLGFTPCKPASRDLAFEELDTDEFLAVVPVGHPLADRASVTPADLVDEPFIRLDHGQDDDEITPIFERVGLTCDARLSTWDDYAIMSMVETGLGVSILPSLILTRNPYRIVTLPLEPRVYRHIGVITRARVAQTLAAERFLSYVKVHAAEIVAEKVAAEAAS